MISKGVGIMGEVVRRRKFHIKQYMGKTFPVVICSPDQALEQDIAGAGYQHFALNLPLASALSAKAGYDRTKNVKETIFSLLPKQQSIYLVDYEMLFDPRYEIDVLKLFYEIARKQKLVARWCGEYRPFTLIYAEPGYPEYQRYKIADYDVICVS